MSRECDDPCLGDAGLRRALKTRRHAPIDVCGLAAGTNELGGAGPSEQRVGVAGREYGAQARIPVDRDLVAHPLRAANEIAQDTPDEIAHRHRLQDALIPRGLPTHRALRQRPTVIFAHAASTPKRIDEYIIDPRDEVPRQPNAMHLNAGLHADDHPDRAEQNRHALASLDDPGQVAVLQVKIVSGGPFETSPMHQNETQGLNARLSRKALLEHGLRPSLQPSPRGPSIGGQCPGDHEERARKITGFDRKFAGSGPVVPTGIPE